MWLVHAGSKVVGLFLGTGTWNFFFFNQLCGSASFFFFFFKKLLQVAGLNLCEEYYSPGQYRAVGEGSAIRSGSSAVGLQQE